MRALLICSALSVAAGFAETITIGAPGNAFDGDCAPFGCALEYQQVYASRLFPGPITITGLTFFNNNFVPGSIASANYTIALSTTSAPVNDLSTTFAQNLGTDKKIFFAGALDGAIGPFNQFTISGTAFPYNPAFGNLLLTVTKSRGEADYSVFLDFLSNAPARTLSRAYSFDASGLASALENNTGLVTQFTYSTASAIPEPASVSLFIVGGLFLSLWRRDQKQC